MTFPGSKPPGWRLKPIGKYGLPPSIEVGRDGRMHNIEVRRGLGMGLDEAAVDAVRQWELAPGLKGGQPVTVAATVEVSFRLQ